MIGGPIIYFSLGWLLPIWPWWQQQIDISPASAQGMAMLQAVVAMATTTTLWILVTLSTPHENMQTLKAFYKKARPMGLWDPVRQAIEQEDPDGTLVEQPSGLILGGFVAAVFGAAWISLGILGIAELAVGRYAEASGLIVAAIAIALVFQRIFRWHINRMDA